MEEFEAIEPLDESEIRQMLPHCLFTLILVFGLNSVCDAGLQKASDVQAPQISQSESIHNALVDMIWNACGSFPQHAMCKELANIYPQTVSKVELELALRIARELQGDEFALREMVPAVAKPHIGFLITAPIETR